MNHNRTRKCDKTDFNLSCKQPLKESRECFTENKCSNEEIKAFLELKDDLSENYVKWRESRRDDPLKDVIVEGYNGYAAEIDFEFLYSQTSQWYMYLKKRGYIYFKSHNGIKMAIIFGGVIVILSVNCTLFYLWSRRKIGLKKL